MGRDALREWDPIPKGVARERAQGYGWTNWYLNRGRFMFGWGKKGGSAVALYPRIEKEFRMVSWRRCL